MSDQLDIDLRSPDGYAHFRTTLATLIRAEAFAEADRFLDVQASLLQSEIGDICRSLTSNAVEIVGWENLCAGVETYSHEQTITAVGVDLSMHVENSASPEGWVEPGLETSYYCDRSYPFSTASRLDLLNPEGDGTPWHGDFVDIDYALETRGLAQLHTAIRASKLSPSRPARFNVPAGFADVVVGTAYLLLRFHQSLARDGQRNGLPRPMPILASEHDFDAFYIESVYMVERVADHRATTDRIFAEEEAAAKQARAQRTEDIIRQITQRRESVLGWSPHVNPDKRAHFIETAEAMDAMTLKILGIPQDRQTWEMRNGEFAALVQQIRYSGHPGASRPAPQPGMALPINPLGFGRKRG